MLFLFVSLYLILCLSLLSPLFPLVPARLGRAGTQSRESRQPLSGRAWDLSWPDPAPGGTLSQVWRHKQPREKSDKRDLEKLTELYTASYMQDSSNLSG